MSDSSNRVLFSVLRPHTAQAYQGFARSHPIFIFCMYVLAVLGVVASLCSLLLNVEWAGPLALLALLPPVVHNFLMLDRPLLLELIRQPSYLYMTALQLVVTGIVCSAVGPMRGAAAVAWFIATSSILQNDAAQSYSIRGAQLMYALATVTSMFVCFALVTFGPKYFVNEEFELSLGSEVFKVLCTRLPHMPELALHLFVRRLGMPDSAQQLA